MVYQGDLTWNIDPGNCQKNSNKNSIKIVKRHTSQKKLLPVSSPLEDMETISRSKLSLLFDPSLFEIRQELQRDKGIDLIVELKQDKSYTNVLTPNKLDRFSKQVCY